MRKIKEKGYGYTTYEKIVLTALLIFFLSMLVMFFIIPRL
jgi:hypothetical protein